MTPETREKATEALRMIQSGVPIATACARVHVSARAVYELFPREVAEAMGERAAITQRPVKEAREEAILVLRRNGWSQTKIGAAFGMSGQRVSEIVSAMLNERRKTQPEPGP